MPNLTITINDRKLTSLTKLEDELTFNKDKNYIFKLSYLGLLEVNGEKAAEFLQGQVTSDVLTTKPTKALPGAMCNLKGRIISLLDIINWHNLLLLLPNDLIEITAKTLKKTAMFSKVTIQKNESLAIFGFYLQNPHDNIPFNLNLPKEQYDCVSDKLYCCYKLTNNLYVFLLDKSIEDEFLKEFAHTSEHGEVSWHNLYLKDSSFEIYPNSSALFLPQRLGLEETSYLSFTKGCYVGQEIIARMHYRSKPKHEMRLYLAKIEQEIFSGQKIYDSETKIEIGEVIDFSPDLNNQYLIAISSIFEHRDIVTFENHVHSCKLNLVPKNYRE